MRGFFQKTLIVDLSNRSYQTELLTETFLRTCLGGKGLGTQLLLERNPVGVAPFSPESHLVIALGPATDSPVHGSCRYGIFAKSPLTGLYSESYAGGSAAVAMSRTGCDAFIISGAADQPLWLEISDQTVAFHPADDLWGLDTFETEARLRKEIAADYPGILVIGPAGENRVRFAIVKNDGWRVSGRTGMGAVLGSKKIKAIVFHGRRKRPFADPRGLKDYAKAKTCRTCFLACGKMAQVQHGRHKGLTLEGPEYDTIHAFGGLCMVEDIKEIVYLNDLCDRMGLDIMSSGNLAAFAIEAANRGKIDVQIDYNQTDQIAALLKKIVLRQDVGGLLAEGIRPASEELGLEDLAVHAKGLEFSGYDPRILKGMGLAYAVTDRGACHLRTTVYKPELSGLIDPDQIEKKAALFIDFEDRCTLYDTLIVCRFYRDLYPWEEISRIIELTTGMNLKKEALQNLALRVTDSTRRFNLREGLRVEENWLPRRLLSEELPGGGRLRPEDLQTLISDYYRLRGWLQNGRLAE
jgi:aldehyde:ferredoxin oxidoreductase